MPPRFTPFSEFTSVDRRQRQLPHWEQEGCTYFLTWRLADSVPESVYRPWREELNSFRRANPEPWGDQTWQEYHARLTERKEQWLNAGYGGCVLRSPETRAIVEECLLHFHGQRYDLDAWVIMPNHVHVLVCPRSAWPLDRILHTWKSYAAHAINKKLSAQGVVWMDESFDHIVRSSAQLDHFRRYIAENPVKAALRPDEYSLWQAAPQERDTGGPPLH